MEKDQLAPHLSYQLLPMVYFVNAHLCPKKILESSKGPQESPQNPVSSFICQ